MSATEAGGITPNPFIDVCNEIDYSSERFGAIRSAAQYK